MARSERDGRSTRGRDGGCSVAMVAGEMVFEEGVDTLLNLRVRSISSSFGSWTPSSVSTSPAHREDKSRSH
ncbi:unnamed protein product [Nippostrongylus brasiliensis]|uniref:Uncharacterized protein n=1 Tax=Nippostrongylus brasiliensis TaxID=27835 RepID=A0A0N4XWL3_NIPBR|nr:unnamed protein product [Nippostrongylus brasiliensis]